MISYNILSTIWSEDTIIAYNEIGICSILFDYDTNEAFELSKMFPKETILQNSNIPTYVADLANSLNNYCNLDKFTIDIATGTPFQREVWQALRKVQPGTTITYSELAERSGYPKAIRAVASAVAANPISIIIPCHRIVPKAGGIGKYRWGSIMKQMLLERERAI